MSKMAPCPFCGTLVLYHSQTEQMECIVVCDACGAQGPTRVTATEAAAAWNQQLHAPETVVGTSTPCFDPALTSMVMAYRRGAEIDYCAEMVARLARGAS